MITRAYFSFMAPPLRKMDWVLANGKSETVPTHREPIAIEAI
jgi:hypothetical protein